MKPSQRILISLVLFFFLVVFTLFLAAGCRQASRNIAGNNSSSEKSIERGTSYLRGRPEEVPKKKTRAEGRESEPPTSSEQSSPANQPPPAEANRRGLLVVVDPGHGNPGNPGPRGPSGLKERDVNFDIAQRLRQLLESAGIKVLMTRDGPTTPLGNPERAELANQNNASLFFRIHSDSSRDPTEGGTRTLWYKPDSERAARIVQKAVVRELGLKDLGIRKQFLVGFQYAQVPAVLVEVAYISNPSEEKLLADPAFRQRAAQGMYDGIREYLEEINNLR